MEEEETKTKAFASLSLTSPFSFTLFANITTPLASSQQISLLQ
jgi:hypothetical protein